MNARFWRLSRFQREWLAAVAVGLAFAIPAHELLHHFHWRPLVAVENWAFDSVMRLTASLDRQSTPELPGLTIVDIDDATWRAPAWGGGEPQRAPREPLLRLVEQSLAGGARQVVLDVLVEEREGADVSPAQVAERQEDERFAGRILDLARAPSFGDGRQVILVRSMRSAPQGPEMRRSAKLDQAIDAAPGRLALGLPYFYADPDGVVRGWEQFRLNCRAPVAGAPAVLTALPSVQLLVYAKERGLNAEEMALLSRARPLSKDPTPCQRGVSAVPVADGKARDAAVDAYWADVRGLLCRDQNTARCPLPRHAGTGTEVGNRVVFRYRPDDLDLRVRVVRAQDLQDGSIDASQGKAFFQDRIVLVAQSFAESGDRYQTPIGPLTGGWVLLNAIDTLQRGHFVERPSGWVTWPFVLLECLVVGWYFTIWHSLRRILLLGGLLIVGLVPFCYFVFRYGVWLDFALPVLGVVFHRMWHNAFYRHPGTGTDGARHDG